VEDNVISTTTTTTTTQKVSPVFDFVEVPKTTTAGSTSTDAPTTAAAEEEEARSYATVGVQFFGVNIVMLTVVLLNAGMAITIFVLVVRLRGGQQGLVETVNDVRRRVITIERTPAFMINPGSSTVLPITAASPAVIGAAHQSVQVQQQVAVPQPSVSAHQRTASDPGTSGRTSTVAGFASRAMGLPARGRDFVLHLTGRAGSTSTPVPVEEVELTNVRSTETENSTTANSTAEATNPTAETFFNASVSMAQASSAVLPG